MEITIKEIASLIGGKVIGDDSLKITNVARIYEAEKNELTFLYLANYEKYLPTTNASVVIIKPTIKKTNDRVTYIEANNPDIAIQKIIIKYFSSQSFISGIDSTAFVHPLATIGNNVTLGRNTVISENCKIGDNTIIYHNSVVLNDTIIGSNCLIYPNVTITNGHVIGNNVIMHSGTVVGSDGFGYFPNENGEYTKVPQIGNVVIEDNVELGSNVSIDRAALGSTRIKEGTKIDNLVQVAHNVEIGKHTAISGQSGIAGSAKVGDHCVFGGQVAISGHIEIGNQVMMGGKSAASKSILTPGKYFGIPAKELRTAFKEEAHIRNLDKYSKQIIELEKKVKELENKFIKDTGNK
jgi:UDP-3-O-[3-hydroxymyristoyl] glucosamine N-acyltransferase